jgi:hypothetical protein
MNERRRREESELPWEEIDRYWMPADFLGMSAK